SRMVVAQTKIQGVIDGRSGPSMTLKTVDSPPDTTVLLTDTTEVGEVEGVFHGRTKQMPMTALIPGLPVQVSGSLNGQNQLVADLGQYNIVGDTTVYFGNGKTNIDPQYQAQLVQLCQQAKGVSAYISQVQGYASAVGSAVLNQTLSSERANAVTAVLEQQ